MYHILNKLHFFGEKVNQISSFMVLTAHLSVADGRGALKCIRRPAEQSLVKDTELGSDSGPAGLPWIMLEKKLFFHLKLMNT